MVNSKSSTLKSMVVAGALALTATSVLAGQVTLYEGSDFKGRSVIAIEAMPNLERSGFGGVAGSIIVGDGAWEACTEAYFRGRCAQLIPGNYGDVRADLGGIASIRQIGSVTSPSARVVIHPDPEPIVTSAEPAPVVTPAPGFRALPIPAGPRVTLYEHTSRGIRAVEITSTTGNLDRVHFNNRADAALVSGGIWRLCDGAQGRGQCFDYPPGQYPTLGALAGRVNSALLISAAPEATSTFQPMSTGRVVFFQYANFGGSSIIVENARVPDMDWTNFKFPPASLRVEAGSWLMCPDIGYQGECQVFGPGEYPVLGTPLERGVASARQVWRPEYGSVETYRYRR